MGGNILGGNFPGGSLMGGNFPGGTFTRTTSIYMSSKSVSQIFKILFQTGDTNIFVLHGVFFSRYVQLKRSFLTKKKTVVKSETHFSREAIEN